MPSGRTHDAITWWLTPPTAAAAWGLTGDLAASASVAAAFLFAGLMFSGDLDLKSVQYKRWGPLRWLWKPYQWLIPHRSPLSHGVLIGPAVRLAYLSAVLGALGVAGLALYHTYGGGPRPEALLTQGAALWQPAERHWALMGFALAGLWLGGASHTAADHLGSGWKRLGRKTRRRR